ncbi:hypothetical protein F4803DRAFT_553839 [Xylaria telfairii]|nr:hypothetical protein F4803DRAFT_553839 [Xylaria telfairii]
MVISENSVLAVIIVLFAVVISVVFWKGKTVVERFAHEMFTAKQQQREQAEGAEAGAEAFIEVEERHIFSSMMLLPPLSRCLKRHAGIAQWII